jgi:hypothetical protein
MTGGLLNIVAYGSQDLFLTGSAEITHFKVVYRRHTNFTMESIRLEFDDAVGFGTQSHVVIPRAGDLIYRSYIEVNIPSISFPRKAQDVTQLQQLYFDSLATLNQIADFMSLNMAAYRQANDQFIAENNVDTGAADMKTAILNEFNIASVGNAQNNLNVQIVNNYRSILANNKQFTAAETNLNDIADNIDEVNSTKEQFITLINNAVEQSKKVVKFYETQVNIALTNLNDALNGNLKFAWVQRLGHAILDYIDVYIGGEKIDRQYGDWLNIWWELTGSEEQKTNYFKMIGNVSELTTFDRTTKPSYIMQIPLQFWFSRFNGLALPFVALEYSDVSIQVKFRRFQDCGYVENTGNGPVSLSDMLDNMGLDLNSSLLIDYIYLDGSERRKFAQAAHEYLIDQIKVNSFENIQQTEMPIRLDFNHPCKEIIWVVQRQSYVNNIDGFTESKWWNYGVNPDGSKNPVLAASLKFNGYDRIEKFEGGFFNLLRPYFHHTRIPADGINVYSFSLHPEESQPSGSCNFSKIENSLLDLFIDPNCFQTTDASGNSEQDSVNIRVYCLAINLLRVIGGLGALAFV